MQIVSLGDILHEMSNPIFWAKRKASQKQYAPDFFGGINIINLSYAEFAHSAVLNFKHVKIPNMSNKM